MSSQSRTRARTTRGRGPDPDADATHDWGPPPRYEEAMAETPATRLAGAPLDGQPAPHGSAPLPALPAVPQVPHRSADQQHREQQPAHADPPAINGLATSAPSQTPAVNPPQQRQPATIQPSAPPAHLMPAAGELGELPEDRTPRGPPPSYQMGAHHPGGAHLVPHAASMTDISATRRPREIRYRSASPGELSDEIYERGGSSSTMASIGGASAQARRCKHKTSGAKIKKGLENIAFFIIKILD